MRKQSGDWTRNRLFHDELPGSLLVQLEASSRGVQQVLWAFASFVVGVVNLWTHLGAKRENAPAVPRAYSSTVEASHHNKSITTSPLGVSSLESSLVSLMCRLLSADIEFVCGWCLMTSVAIDNGSSLIRSGLAGFDEPRMVFPNIIGSRRNLPGALIGMLPKEHYVGDEAWSKRGIVDMKQCISQEGVILPEIQLVWEHALRRLDNVHLVMSTNPFIDDATRAMSAEILFEALNVQALALVPDAVLSLVANGRKSGVVVDMGYGVPRVSAVANWQIEKSVKCPPEFRGHALTEHVKLFLTYAGFSASSSSEMDTASLLLKEQLGSLDPNCGAKQYELPDGQIVEMTGDERRDCGAQLFDFRVPADWRILMPLFQLPISKDLLPLIGRHVCDCSLQSTVYSLLSRSTVGSVVLTGGTTKMEGFQNRFEACLPGVNSILDPGSVWKGCSLAAKTNLFLSQSRADYMEGK